MKNQLFLILFLLAPLSAQAFFPQTTSLSCDNPASAVSLVVRVGAFAGESNNWGLEIYEFDKQSRRPVGLTDHLAGRLQGGEKNVMTMIEGRAGHVYGVIRRTGAQSFVYQDRRGAMPCVML
ncbi:MAG: hypothetical protein KF802_03320 [Bdellovibrionaceae bacterium]|nr:hypothetical protein [Pseudobdellovibrionaceae bacterium]MBX3033349.1 hypothetical protein [Pseudobdellovibrionaceae bacterium]